MENFFICIILSGIFIVCFALIWMVVEKKKSWDYEAELRERKRELEEVISDAEQLLTELNNFSGYIVDQLEEKQQYLEELLREIDEKPQMTGKAESAEEENRNPEFINEPEKVNEKPEKDYTDSVLEREGKLISLDDRKREVIKLYKKGISSTEIARMLNMGKGEIELISRMCR